MEGMPEFSTSPLQNVVTISYCHKYFPIISSWKLSVHVCTSSYALAELEETEDVNSLAHEWVFSPPTPMFHENPADRTPNGSLNPTSYPKEADHDVEREMEFVADCALVT